MFNGELDWKTLVGLLSTGGLIGSLITYWLKSRIDSRNLERQWKRQYYFDDLKRQRELLLEFLGTPYSEFINLTSVDETWEVAWRRNKARTVTEWVNHYQPLFTSDVQQALIRLANLAVSLVSDESLKLVQQVNVDKIAQESYEIIQDHVERIARELKGR